MIQYRDQVRFDLHSDQGRRRANQRNVDVEDKKQLEVRQFLQLCLEIINIPWRILSIVQSNSKPVVA